MDWGLAKILRDVGSNREEAGNGLLTRPSLGRELKTGETRSGTIMGSPSFMAPEQARGEVVDTPADVFSLGAILCAILVGEGPFDHAKSSAAIIQLSAAGDLTTAFRKLDESKIDSDLIELAKGCLDPNPAARIQNAGEVAKSIADYRSAVEMRLQQAQTERAAAATRVVEQKKRRRLVALATAALLVVLVGGIAVSSNQAFRAIQAEKATSEQLTKTNLAKRDAEHARDVAKNRYQVAMNAFNDMIFTIQNKLATRPNTLELRKELLAGARIGLKQLLTETEDQNEPDQKMAWSHIQMGIIEKLFGNNDEARREFEEAHKLAVRMVKSNPDRLDAQHDLSAALAHLGDEALRRNESLEALEFYKQKIDLDRRITERDPNNLVHQRDLSLSLGRMGQVALQHGQVTEAYDYYQQKLENSKRIAASDPANAMFQRDLANSHELLGDAAGYLNKPEQVLENYRNMNEIMQRLLDADTSNVQRQRDVSISLVKLGNYCEDTSKLDAALDYYERAANILKRMADADPQNASVQCELFVAYDNLGNVESARSKFTNASQWLSKAREVLLPLHEKQLLVGQLQNALADVEQKIAQVLEHINAEPRD